MLSMELIQDGLDNTLRDMRVDLEDVLGKNVSKQQKDAIIYKTLGAINTLWNMIRVTEVDMDTEDKTDA